MGVKENKCRRQCKQILTYILKTANNYFVILSRKLFSYLVNKGTKNAKIYVSSMLTCLDELLSYRLKKEKGVLLTSKHFGDN